MSEHDDAVIAKYAQYVADHIDTTLVIKCTDGVSMERACELATKRLETEGWQGRVYPEGFFTAPHMVQEMARQCPSNGKRTVHLRIHDDRGFARIVKLTLLGPEGGPR